MSETHQIDNIQQWYYSCDCGHEVLQVTFLPDEEEFDLAMLYYGGWRRYTIREKLRHIWRILRTGKVYADQICLSKHAAATLRDHITSCLTDDAWQTITVSNAP